MKTIRLALICAFAILLMGGYAASQLAYFSGSVADYYQKVDSPSIRMLALILLVASIVVSLLKEPKDPEE